MAPPLLWAWLLLCVGGAGGGDCRGRRLLLRGGAGPGGGGAVSDGPGNYSERGDCAWLLSAPPGSRLQLRVRWLRTECAFDFLFVHDGPSPRSPLLAALSGSAPPPPLQATSGQMLLHLFSDANYNLGGFSASFVPSSCPGGCSGRGLCAPPGRCRCHPGWGGPSCSRPLCETCVNGGACNPVTRRCECPPGFIGSRCELPLGGPGGGGRWVTLSRGDPKFPPRFAAAGAFLPQTGGLYIFGGQDLNRVLGDLVVFNLSTNTWTRILLRPAPAPRHSHVAAQWRGALLVSGGELGGGAGLSRDVWLFRPGRGWRELRPRGLGRGPRLAAHAAAVVDDWLYVFGGRTSGDAFSSELWRFQLRLWGWQRVQPWGGRAPAVAGHSLLFHPPSRCLLVHGGHRPHSARFSARSNSSFLFHLGGRHWAPLRPREGASGPPPTAFHSATLLGGYMVTYGGNVHVHYAEEKCYEAQAFFYHLGCHQWVPGADLARAGNEPPPRPSPGGGRYGHVAAALGGRVLLVAGGFSGVARGDLVAFKVPLGGGPHDVPPPGCLGLPPLLSDCSSCLLLGAPPGPPGPFGWCVQNASCLPAHEQWRCAPGLLAGSPGWWGPRPQFLRDLPQCRSHDLPPGLHLLTYLHPKNESQPDKVTIVRSTTVTLRPGGEGAAGLSLVYAGFLHPLLGPDPPDPKSDPPGTPPDLDLDLDPDLDPGPRVWARIQRLHVVAKLGREPGSTEMEEVGRWAAPQERELRPLRRGGSRALLGGGRRRQRGQRWALRVEGSRDGSAGGLSSELTLVWDRTGVPGGSEISFFFLEPFRGPPGGCGLLPSCPSCVADLGCAWCPPRGVCVPRSPPPPPEMCGGGEGSGGGRGTGGGSPPRPHPPRLRPLRGASGVPEMCGGPFL